MTCFKVPQPPAGKYWPDENEQDDHQSGHDEIRHGNADGGERHQRKIEPAAAADRGNNSGGESQAQGKRQRQNSQRGRNRQAGGNHIVHAEIGHAEAQAEIEMQILVQFNPILLRHGQVEVVSLGVQIFDAVRRFALAAKWPSGDGVHQEKRNREDGPQRPNIHSDAPQQETKSPATSAFEELLFFIFDRSKL